MQYAIIDYDLALELFGDEAQYMRKSNDGTQVIVHKEILDAARPAQPMMLNLTYNDEGDVEEPPYPFPLYSGDEINALPEFTSKEEPMMEQATKEEAPKSKDNFWEGVK